MKGKCRCNRVLNVYEDTDVIQCSCGRIIVKLNGKWKLYEAKK